jgi:uncharacterized protein YjbI with pentapeptide repeats
MANRQHLEILDKGVKVWNDWRSNNPRIIPDLRKANLKGRHLWCVDFHEADLFDADFSEADCMGALFQKAKLGGATIEKINIQMANFDGSNVNSVKYKKL